MNEPIDCDYTDEAVCPYCGHQHEDSHEFFPRNQEDTTAFCYKCEKEFSLTRHISVHYSSEPKKP